MILFYYSISSHHGTGIQLEWQKVASERENHFWKSTSWTYNNQMHLFSLFSQGKMEDNVSSVWHNMTLKKKQDKKHTEPHTTFLHLFSSFPTSYHRMPLWPALSALCAVNALFCPTPPNTGPHLLGAQLTAPTLNSCSSTAAGPASAWSKDHCSSAGKTTLFMCVVQVIRTATLSSKAHFWSDNNLDPAVIWFSSLKLQDLPTSCTVQQILTHLKVKVCTHLHGKWKNCKNIYHNFHFFLYI